MAKKKKNDAQPTPAAGNDNMGKYSVKTSSKKLNKREALIRILTIILIILLLFLFGLFACTTYISNGNFTVSTNADAFNAGIAISETPDFENPARILEGSAFENMREGTYTLLPPDINDYDGSHNFLTEDGMFYFTYSFYVKNTGTEKAGYVAKLNVESATQGADEAVRVMVTHNDESEVYAKPALGSSSVLEQYADKNFVSNRHVGNFSNENFEAGAVDRFTVAIWFEGDDPECVDDILEGEVKFSMDLQLIETLDDSGESA
ncbi:MAG: hypothetical protein IJZ88_04765 [Clostridia bacterium]|nr:hypothetical protein [Clostridia bacterium]